MITITDKVKTFAKVADELGFSTRTLRSHINKDDKLKDEIPRGAQSLKSQKLLYNKFGYPPEVNRADYENV